MPDEAGGRSEQSARRKPSLKSLLLPLFGVTGALLAMVLVYLGYDYISVRSFPCDAIFRQASLGLSTKISFLKTKGEVKIGREPMVELSERAQMAALNLKTCCTVLDAGRLNAEEFLQCKAKARAYESKLDEILSVVQRVARQKESSPSSGERASGVAKPAAVKAPTTADALERLPAIAPAEATVRIEETIKAARQISQSFNRDVIEVRKAQALETLKLEAPRQVDVASQEKEPNNDGLNTNVMPLGVWVSAIIGEPSDADMFAFETPAMHRDWISIALDNRSTTLEPRLELFNSDKVSLGTRHSTTPGAGLVYRFLGGPDERYFVRVSNYYGKSIGGYLLRVVATKAFDAHEPNDNVLTARAIAIGKEIQAAIMDGKDLDFFRVEPPAGASRIEVKVANMSTTLRPRVDLYDASKSHIGNRQNTTGGGDVAYSQVVTPGAQFYIRVGDYYGEAEGAYRLTVSFSK